MSSEGSQSSNFCTALGWPVSSKPGSVTVRMAVQAASKARRGSKLLAAQDSAKALPNTIPASSCSIVRQQTT